MRTDSRYLVLVVFFALAAITSSCKMFNQIGENVGDGVGRGLTPHVDSLGALAVGSIRRGFDQAEFDILLDSLVHRLSDSLDTSVEQVRDILLGNDTAVLMSGLRDTLVGDVTQQRVNEMVAGIIEGLAGEQTRRELASIRDEILGEALRANLASLRDELTGPVTEARLVALARAFVAEIGRSYADTLQPQIRSDIEYTAGQTQGLLNWIKDNLIAIIIVIGVVVAGLIWLAWRLRTRRIEAERKRDVNGRIAEILTGQIDDLRNDHPQLYEQIKDRVQREAVKDKVEPTLREMLDEQGILRSK